MNRSLITEALSLFILSALGIYGGLTLYLNRDVRTQSSVLAPGIYVLTLGGLLFLTALVYACLASRRAPRMGAVDTIRRSVAWVSPIVVKMVGAFALYAYLIDLVGYSAPTVLFLLTAFRLLGVKSWKTNIALTALVTIFFYIVFIHYCEMVFPHGSLFE